MKTYTTLLFLCLFISFSALAQNKTYYVSPSGNDANDGLTTGTAWQTISKVSGFDLEPGDQVLFQGGQVFTGSILLQANDNGTPASPVIISSYGTGKAVINSGTATGLLATNVGGFEVRNLAFTGSGIGSNNKVGVEVEIKQTTADLDHVILYGLSVSGYGRNGILIIADGTDKGFNHVRIEYCDAFDNGYSGIETYGNWPDISHTDFAIRYCRAFSNLGVATYTASHSGNGILVSGVDGALIEFCEAFNNGQNNGSSNGGPVGIWVYDTKNATIQFCESHHNKAGGNYDGGGFDIDGGAQNCIIQYCYSHNNEGAGFGMYEYGSPNTYTNNKIRYNISQNDGRKNGYGALSFWAVDNTHQLNNSEIYNNTVYLDNSNLVNGVFPTAVKISGPNFNNIKIRNNIFYLTSGVNTIVSTDVFPTSALHFQNNVYYSVSGTPLFYWGGTTYYSLAAWKAAAPGQEMDGATSFDRTTDPMLVSPGTGDSIRPAKGGNLSSLSGYRLQSGSPLINAAMSFPGMGTRDFFGSAIPQGGAYDIGSGEYVNSILPVTLLSFSGTLSFGQGILKWEVGQEEDIAFYEVQRSADNRKFEPAGKVNALGRRQYLFTDKQAGSPVYYRLRIVSNNGSSAFSSTIRLHEKGSNKLYVVYREGAGLSLLLESDKAEITQIRIFDAQGRLVYTAQQSIYKGTNLIEVPQAREWPGGTYIIHSGLQTIKFVKQGY